VGVNTGLRGRDCRSEDASADRTLSPGTPALSDAAPVFVFVQHKSRTVDRGVCGGTAVEAGGHYPGLAAASSLRVAGRTAFRRAWSAIRPRHAILDQGRACASRWVVSASVGVVVELNPLGA
jgi:hypothetical protein